MHRRVDDGNQSSSDVVGCTSQGACRFSSQDNLIKTASKTCSQSSGPKVQHGTILMQVSLEQLYARYVPMSSCGIVYINI